MTPHRPPSLALAILDWVVPDNEPLVGDLLEAGRTRSQMWFWWQVALTVGMRASAEVRTHPRLSAETLLVSTAMLALLAFHAVVAASLINHLRLIHDPGIVLSATGRHQAWHVAGAMAGFVCAIIAGRLIGRFHREHPTVAAVAFAVSAVGAAYMNLLLFAPHPTLQPAFMPAGAAVQIGESMLFIAGLFTGMATSPAQIRSGIVAAIGIAVASAAPPVLHAQTATPGTFDVASIKRNTSENIRGSGFAAPQPGGRYIAVGVTLDSNRTAVPVLIVDHAEPPTPD